jgi:hypothetical protein
VQYSLIYDAATAPFPYPLESLVGFFPLAVGIAVVRRPELLEKTSLRFNRLLGTLGIIFGAVILVGVPLIVWIALHELRSGLVTHRYTLVEGPVRDFIAGQPDGHPMERFTVDGHAFQYSPYTSPGFNQVSTQHGPMREGLRVRIAEIEGNIARLEVAR